MKSEAKAYLHSWIYEEDPHVPQSYQAHERAYIIDKMEEEPNPLHLRKYFVPTWMTPTEWREFLNIHLIPDSL